MEGTFWALVPTLIAVIFALITKEVFISLLMGIIAGSMFIAGGNPVEAFNELFGVMAHKMGADIFVSGEAAHISGLGNAGILIFILELGIIVVLMNKSGGTQSFGKLIASKIHSRKGALLSTTTLGCMIFMDDYFNRLAVGTIMRPVTDKYRISRIKLAYIIGSVSVSVCILVPISSWAGAITGNIGESIGDGFDAFSIYLDTLLCNFYPILTLLFLFISSAFDFSPFGMKKYAVIAENDEPAAPTSQNEKGKYASDILDGKAENEHFISFIHELDSITERMNPLCRHCNKTPLSGMCLYHQMHSGTSELGQYCTER